MSAAAPTTEARARLWRWGPVMVLALLPALPLLVGSGLVNTRAGGDSPFLLVRVHQLVYSLRAGIFPVRWMPQAAYGLGYPFFNFYASLPFYLAAALKLVGFGYIWSVKLTQALGFVLAAMAMYTLSQELWRSGAFPRAEEQTPRVAALTSLLVAFVYSCAPFHMLNVYVRGDSLSEFFAFVFFPLILCRILRLHRKPNVHNAIWVALSYAGLLLTHNISAVIFTPFALLYVLILTVRQPLREISEAPSDIAPRPAHTQWTSALFCLAALGAGAVLSCWFWLPALAESGSVYLRDMTTGYFHYGQHFRSLDLVQRSAAFDYSITGDQNPFRMGLVQAALALAGLVALAAWWSRERRFEPQSAFLTLVLAGSTFMITPLSRLLWDHLPLLPLVQFPWRFLSLQAVGTSLVVAYLVPRRPRSILGVTFLLGTIVFLSAWVGLHPERLFIGEADITPQRLMLYEYFTANVGTTIRTDYLPIAVDPRPYTSEVLLSKAEKPVPLALEGHVASAQLVDAGPISERWLIEVDSPASLLAFHTYYFAGWGAVVDGQQTTVEAIPGLGYIGLRLGPGRHEVLLHLTRTSVQRLTEGSSALVALLLLCAWLRERRPQRHTLAAVAAMLFVLAVLFTLARSAQPAVPREQLLDLTMDYDRIPYLHHNPSGVRFGSAARLTRYELSASEIQAGESLTLTMHWDDLHGNDLRAKVSLVSSAQHLFGVPLSLSSDEQPLNTQCIQHVLHIPETSMRGIHLLSLEVYGPDGEIRAVNAQGETLGRTYLLPIRIDNWMYAGSDAPILQQFGDRIALAQAQVVQRVADRLEVALTWQVLAQPVQNYKVALRLRAADGAEVAQLDVQPGYGFLPTGMWRPGELIADRYLLPLDDGTPPGQHYHLDVTLYEAATLRPLSTASIPEIAVSHPTVRQDYPILKAFGGELALSEAQLVKQELGQAERLTVAVKWAALAQMDGDYECQLTLLDPTGTAVAYSETQPLAAAYATSRWPKNAIVASRYQLQIPPDIPAGDYTATIAVGEVISARASGVFTLAQLVRVVQAQRNFVIPSMQHTVGADFGQDVRLLGYDLQQTEDDLHLTLHWQALSAMSTDYKVFVHLFNAQTETIVSQQDVLAGGDAYRTTHWVQQEIASDQIRLKLEGVPAGSYSLAVGLYDSKGRLPAKTTAGYKVSADRLLLSEALRVP